jgi:Secretion system C-terminal sorting domain
MAKFKFYRLITTNHLFNMKKITLLFILVVFRMALYAQIPIQTFEDTELKPITKVLAKFKTDSCVYIGGHSWDIFNETPYVTKIDGNGKVAWRWTSTAPGFETTLAIMACDSSVYAVTNKLNLSSNFELYKLNSSDGSVIWSTTFSNSWDSEWLLHSYTDSTVAFLGSHRFILVNKSTGTVLEDLTLQAYADIRPSIDPYGYIYCAGKDTVYKFDNLNHDSLLWKRSYSNFPTWMEYPRVIYADSTNLYVVGEGSSIQSHQLFMKFDPANGNAIYSTILTLVDYKVRDLLDRDGFIYVAEGAGYVGASDSYITYFKIEKQTGSLAWYRMEQLDTLPNIPYTQYGFIGPDKDYELISIDVDSHGDLYGTGLYRGYSFGTCFIFKASGTDGSVLWQHTVIDDSSRYDTFGGGTVAWVNNNRVYFVETLKANDYDEEDNNVITAIVESDTSTGVILNKVYDGGSYKLASKVADLQRLPNGNIISFVQLGRGIQVLCSDSLLNLIWERRFYNRFVYPYNVLKADKIAIGDNATIAFCATLHSHQEYITNTQYPDTIYYFRLDSAGNLLSRTAFGFPQPLTDPKVVFDLTYDGTHGMLYFFDGNMIKFLLFNNGNLQYNVTVPNSNTNFEPTSIGTDLNSQFALYTRFVSNNLHLIKYDKTTGYGYNLDTIPGMSQRSIVYKIDSNRVIISGKSPTAFYERITMYDWTLGDTIWTSDVLGGGYQSHIRVAYDSSTNAVYAVRREMQNKLSFERFNATTGQLLWATSYATTFDAICNDLTYDTFNHKLIGVGSVENGFNDYSAVIWTFDSSGVALDTIVNLTAPLEQRAAAANSQQMNVASSYNQAEATAALVINSQRVLIAACALNSSVTTGAFFDLSPSGIVNAIGAPMDASKNILVFPNPFKSGVNIKLSEEGVHKLALYDVQGRYLQSSVVDSPSQEMYYLDLSTLQSGYYILQVTDKKQQQYNFRIVKQ